MYVIGRMAPFGGWAWRKGVWLTTHVQSAQVYPTLTEAQEAATAFDTVMTYEEAQALMIAQAL